MLVYPDLDPVAFTVFSFEVRWYGIAYVVGILLAWKVCTRLARQAFSSVAPKDVDEFIPWATLGIILGGRIGNAVFYHADYYLLRPWEIFYIWQPGMSFHGGFLGVLVALLLFTSHRRLSLLDMGDVLSVGAPIGLFFGRIANFINAELYGRMTDVAWGMVFPMAGPFPRHPSQLYEAFLEGILLFIVLLVLSQQKKIRQYKGMLTSIFLIGYAVVRSVAEVYREPDGVVSFLSVDITLGQLYSLPLILAGLVIGVISYKKSNA